MKMSAYDEQSRFTISLPYEQACHLKGLSDDLGITVSGLISVLLDLAYPDDVLDFIVSHCLNEEGVPVNHGMYLKPPVKKRPTRSNLMGLHQQIGRIVDGGVVVSGYKGDKHA